MTVPDADKRLRVRVDPIRCTAFGFCAEFCPELFELDEWGYAWLKTRDVDGAAERLVRETARLCPRGAIAIDEVVRGDASVETRRPVLRLLDISRISNKP
ncbi:MAG TPA: ferredoxin [Thermomicrobiales bacterium]|jgi:ferredoxin|nr:ferredoxin [Thermomicrobiales bacterium]